MIKLFITDLDGCMTDPFITPDWDAFSKVRELNLKSAGDPAIPQLSICTGRPMPYAEAMAQILGIEIPCVFESGGGMYDVKKNKITWTDALDEQAKQHVIEIKAWAKEHIISRYDGTIPEFAKFTDIGIIHQDAQVIEKIRDESIDFITGRYDEFEVHYTEVSVNIILKKANKGYGIRMLSAHLGFDLSEVAYIGDSSGDIPGLQIVGMPFAPANAASHTKEVAEVLENRSTKGVLEAYYKIIERNLNS